MKARKKCPVAGPTTDCCANKDTCIEEKQRVRQPAVNYTKQNKTKKEQIYTYRFASMKVGMYDCMRTDRESEFSNKLSGILRQTSQQTCMLVCLWMYVCIRSESESASLVTTAAQGCASDLCMPRCVCASVRAGTISLLSLVCLFVCRCTPWHMNTHTKNTGQYMSSNQWKSTISLSSTLSQYSATRNTQTHESHETPAKMLVGRADNWLLSK